MSGGDGPDGERRRVPPALIQHDAELAGAERRVLSRLDPGLAALVLACAVMLLLVGVVLPWVGAASGWQVLVSGGAGVLPRLFAATATGFGVLGSAAGLLSRRWVVAWVCAVGCGFTALCGIAAIWSRQTAEAGARPGVGLVLALLAILLLTWQWVRLSWSRPAG